MSGLTTTGPRPAHSRAADTSSTPSNGTSLATAAAAGTLPRQLWWLVGSEWTKLRSVRSTVVSLLAMAIVTVGLGAAIAAGTVARWGSLPKAEQLSFDPASRSLAGLFLGQLVIGVLGCLVLSAEYSTGTIHATFSASPQRVTVLAVKTAVFAAVAFVVSLATCLASFWTAQAIYATKHLDTSLSAPGVARVVVGGALYLSVVGVLGLGLGAVLRHTAGTISTLFGLLLVLPILVNFLPSDWQADITKYLPGSAGSGIFQLHQDAGTLGPWTGFALFCGYALLALVGGAFMLRSRDA